MDSFSSSSGLGFPPTSSLPPPSALSLDLEKYFDGYRYNGSHQVEETSTPNGPVGSVPDTEDPVPASNGAAADSDKSKTGEGKLLIEKTTMKKVRKQRYAFQTRSQVDILDDGYRWRKYGQKAVKNNKFPRTFKCPNKSYYRCTYQGCNVKKQVQRLNKDEGVVVTTYEGIHSHPIERSNDNFEHILTQMHIISSSLPPSHDMVYR